MGDALELGQTYEDTFAFQRFDEAWTLDTCRALLHEVAAGRTLREAACNLLDKYSASCLCGRCVTVRDALAAYDRAREGRE